MDVQLFALKAETIKPQALTYHLATERTIAMSLAYLEQTMIFQYYFIFGIRTESNYIRCICVCSFHTQEAFIQRHQTPRYKATIFIIREAMQAVVCVQL